MPTGISFSAGGVSPLACTGWDELFPFLPAGEKWALQRRGQRVAHTIAADFSLWRVNRAYPADSYVEHTLVCSTRATKTPRYGGIPGRARAAPARASGHTHPRCISPSHSPGQTRGVGRGSLQWVDRTRRRWRTSWVSGRSPIPAV